MKWRVLGGRDLGRAGKRELRVECMKSIDCEKLRGQTSFSSIVFFGDSRLAYLILSLLS